MVFRKFLGFSSAKTLRCSGEHTQTGVVCEVGVDEYEQGLMRKHENTLSDKEDLLAHYQKVVGVSSSPICLTYSQNKNIDNIVTEIINGEPDLEFLSEDDVAQKCGALKTLQLKKVL